MKLWHDDIRPPPDASWSWARTNADAILLLTAHWPIDECSLDHDLGLHDHDPAAAAEMYGDDFDMLPAATESDEDGVALVDWMIARDRVPATVTIHSHNPAGAARMAARLWAAGHACTVRPYSAEQRR
ncbi:MAG TPA: cyclic-phosphate processing receiver domain-containing protein [Solirubrobacteraceae bacterium]